MTTAMLLMLVDKKTKFPLSIMSGKSTVFMTRDKEKENVTILKYV
jgi:hypothetical protein